MLEQIETFSRDHQFTIAALTAIGTLLAVAASITLALIAARSNRTRLEASVSITRVVGAGVPQENPPRFLSVSVTNVGNSTLWLEWGFFNWRIPFSGEYATVNPMDGYAGMTIGDTGIPLPQVTFPVEVLPRVTKQFRLSTFETFRDVSAEAYRHLSWLGWLRFRYQRAFVVTSDGRRFRAQLTTQVKRVLQEIVKDTGPSTGASE